MEGRAAAPGRLRPRCRWALRRSRQHSRRSLTGRATGAEPQIGARIIAKPNLSQELTAVILAAGHGTRMRSRTPKVLHPICGRPMVDWVVDAVMAAGATDVQAIVSSHHAEVAAHLDGRTEVIYQREAEGTGHAVLQVPPEGLSRGDGLVVNG